MIQQRKTECMIVNPIGMSATKKEKWKRLEDGQVQMFQIEAGTVVGFFAAVG